MTNIYDSIQNKFSNTLFNKYEQKLYKIMKFITKIF